jgi:predicted component of type VI protein secretion system
MIIVVVAEIKEPGHKDWLKISNEHPEKGSHHKRLIHSR